MRKLMFETRLGEWLLGAFERWTGLAIVEANGLGQETARRPMATKKSPALGRMDAGLQG